MYMFINYLKYKMVAKQHKDCSLCSCILLICVSFMSIGRKNLSSHKTTSLFKNNNWENADCFPNLR